MSTVWHSNYLGTHGEAGTKVNTLLGYPFGLDLRGLPSYPMSLGVVRQLARVFGFVAAYNIYLLLGFPLAGLAMFLLVYYIIRRYSPAVIGGFAYAFTSWHLVRAAEHISLASTYCLPFFFLALVYFWRRRSILSCMFLIAAGALAFLTDYHMGYFCAVMAAVWILTMLVMSARGTNTFEAIDKRLLLLGVLVIVLTAVLAFPTARTILFQNTLQYKEYKPRGTQVDVELNSSRAWNYFVPSYYNPLLGRLARGFNLAHRGPLPFTETPAYLGILPFGFAVYALWVALGRRRHSPVKGGSLTGGTPGASEPSESPADDTSSSHAHLESSVDGARASPGRTETMGSEAAAEDGSTGRSQDSSGERRRGLAAFRPFIAFGAAMAVTGFMLSLPPEWTIGGKKIPWVSYVQRWIIPPLRGYSRWAVVVLFAVILLASLGWTILLEKRRFSARSVLALTLVAVILVGADYTISPPSRARELPGVPAVLKAMRRTPAGSPLIIYPLTNPNDFRFYRFEYYQTYHQRPMLNGTTRATFDDLYRLAVIGYNSPYTPRMLRTLGIDYAAFLTGDFDSDVKFAPRELPPGYRLVKSAGRDYLYALDAVPAPVIPLYFSGFQAPAVFPDGMAYAPMSNSTSSIKLDVRVAGGFEISFVAFSPGAPREFEFLLDGKELGRVTIPDAWVRFVLPATDLSKGKHDLVIRTAARPSAMNGSQFGLGTRIDVYLVTGDFSVDTAR